MMKYVEEYILEIVIFSPRTLINTSAFKNNKLNYTHIYLYL